jgi:hypothetical protein
LGEQYKIIETPDKGTATQADPQPKLPGEELFSSRWFSLGVRGSIPQKGPFFYPQNSGFYQHDSLIRMDKNNRWTAPADIVINISLAYSLEQNMEQTFAIYGYGVM